ARVLRPLSESDRRFWEIANYVVALVILVAIGLVWSVRRRHEKPMPLLPPQQVGLARAREG
ncbi:MAG: hypothetical protein RMN24_04895, partial [Anaerolineae bacterium]|nr:hypothetical protein [Anaerolineae bacterium]